MLSEQISDSWQLDKPEKYEPETWGKKLLFPVGQCDCTLSGFDWRSILDWTFNDWQLSHQWHSEKKTNNVGLFC